MSSILIDTSVWIEYFRSEDSYQIIDELIDRNEICTNDLILTELLPYLYIKKKKELAHYMLAIPRIDLHINWDLIMHMQLQNLKNGINKVGISDLLILQNVIENDLALYTLDTHFKLMKELFDFELFSEV